MKLVTMSRPSDPKKNQDLRTPRRTSHASQPRPRCRSVSGKFESLLRDIERALSAELASHRDVVAQLFVGPCDSIIELTSEPVADGLESSAAPEGVTDLICGRPADGAMFVSLLARPVQNMVAPAS